MATFAGNAEDELDCRIITKEEEFLELAGGWHDLYQRVGKNPFADFEPAAIWWRHVGKPSGAALHITVLYRDGKLTGLLPFVVYTKHGFRLMRWLGHDVFYGPIQLVDNSDDIPHLWQTAYGSHHYDFAEVKYITPDTPEQQTISSFAFKVMVDKNDHMSYLRFNGQTGEEWLNSFSNHARRKQKLRLKNMVKKGEVLFHTYQKGEHPLSLFDEMIEQKKTWCEENNKQSAIFDAPEFMRELIRKADANNNFLANWLTCGGRVIGFEMGFLSGTIYYCYMVGYDYAWYNFSPGDLVFCYAISHAADSGLSVFHFMEGRHAYKERYVNCQETIDAYAFCRTGRGVLGLILHRSWQFVKRVKDLCLDLIRRLTPRKKKCSGAKCD